MEMIKCADFLSLLQLTHWGRVTHVCTSKLNIGSENGLSPSRRQAIIWTNAGIWLIRALGTKFSEIHTFSFKKMHLKMLSAKWDQFCLSLYVLGDLVTGLPSATVFQYFVTEITLWLLKLSWNFGQNTEIIAVCYWSEFPEVGSPVVIEFCCVHYEAISWDFCTWHFGLLYIEILLDWIWIWHYVIYVWSRKHAWTTVILMMILFYVLSNRTHASLNKMADNCLKTISSTLY